jgi:hypothetical protein
MRAVLEHDDSALQGELKPWFLAVGIAHRSRELPMGDAHATQKPAPLVTIASGAGKSLLRLHEDLKGVEEQHELLAALVANQQVLLEEVERVFGRPPLEGQLGKSTHFSQALVAVQLVIPRPADGLQEGADLVVG